MGVIAGTAVAVVITTVVVVIVAVIVVVRSVTYQSRLNCQLFISDVKSSMVRTGSTGMVELN